MYKLPCPDNVLYLGSVRKAATSQGAAAEEEEGWRWKGGRSGRVLTKRRHTRTRGMMLESLALSLCDLIAVCSREPTVFHTYFFATSLQN